MRRVVFIAGPTGAGKTALAELISEHLDMEVISADSRQVYRHMNIGTNKPDPRLLSKLPHHLIDVIEPDQRFSASKFLRLADRAWEEIFSRGRIPCVVGGTGLYMRAFEWGLCDAPGADDGIREHLKRRLKVEGREKLYAELEKVDPHASSKISPQDTQRLIRYLEVYYVTGKPISWFWKRQAFNQRRRYEVLKLYVGVSFDELVFYLQRRCREMVKKGLVDEVAELVAKFGEGAPGLKTIGYREFVPVVKGEKKLDDATSEFFKNTKAYAKRQIVWFKKELNEMLIVEPGSVVRVIDTIKQFMEKGKVAVSGF